MYGKKKVVFCSIAFFVLQISNVIGQGATPESPSLNGITINAAVFASEVTGGSEHDEPLTELNPGTADEWEGALSYNIDLWFVLIKKLNFNIRCVFTNRSDEKQTFLRDLVLNNGANMTLNPLTFTNDSKGVAYAHHVDSARYKLFIKTPSSETSWSSLGNVFRPVLWLSIVIAITLMSLVLVAIEHVGYKAKLGTYLEAPADTGQLFIVILGNFCYQGAVQIASGCAGRVVIFSSLVCGYLIYISYGTLVISQLSAVKLSLPFETLQQLAARGNYRLLVPNDPSVLEDIEMSRKNKSNALAAVWDSLLPSTVGSANTFTTEIIGLSQLCADNVAILASEKRITTKRMKKSNCSATALRPVYFQNNLGFALNPNNTFNKILKKTINRMRETGIMHRWRKYWDVYDGFSRETGKLPTTLKPITLSTMLPVLGIVGAGMVASIAILILEITYKRWDDFNTQRMREKQVKMFRARHPPLPFAH